jgi:hypothetical protein
MSRSGGLVHVSDGEDNLGDFRRIAEGRHAAFVVVQGGHDADLGLIGLADRRYPHRRPGPVGLHATRFQHRDLDPERADLLRQDLGKAAYGPFGGLVSGQAGGREAPADRGNLNDVASALSAQDRERRLGHVHDAEQVGLDLLGEVGQGHVFHRGQVGVPGVVDDHVETAERLHPGGHGVLRRDRVGDVEGCRQDLTAVSLRQVSQGLRAARGGDQTMTVRQNTTMFH